MPTRAIAPIVGVDNDTVAEDLKSPVGNPTPVREVHGLDGKTYPPKPDVSRVDAKVKTSRGEIQSATPPRRQDLAQPFRVRLPECAMCCGAKTLRLGCCA